MKLTLLEMVQDILSDMESDVVNDIAEVEAAQVATIIKSTYYDLINVRDWDFLKKYRQLTAVGDTTQPTKMQLPENVGQVYTLWYRTDETGDSNQEWTKLIFLPPEEFIDFANSRSTGDSDVTAYATDEGPTLNIVTDEMPQYWTSFNDDFIYMDAIDLSEESTLQQSKTKAYVKEEPTWITSDTFTPEMSAELFLLLLNESKSRCFLRLKQQPDPKSESMSKRLYRKFFIDSSRTEKKTVDFNWGR